MPARTAAAVHRRGSAAGPGRVESERRASEIAQKAARLARRRSQATLDVDKLTSSVTAKKFRELTADEARIAKWPAWRKTVRRVVFDPMFERVSLLVIVVNTITLSMYDPTDKDCATSLCKQLAYFEYFFLAIFTIEMVLKLIALGVYNRADSYLRDAWNVLDGVIVIAGLLEVMQPLLGIDGAGVTGLRALRVLRPLKSVKSVPSVQVIVMSILACLPRLLDVCLLYFFFAFTMGIIAVQQWKGILLRRCVSPVGEAHPSDDRVCRPVEEHTIFGGHYCDWGYLCLEKVNPEQGKVHFDNIATAMLTLYTAISLEGWSSMMYHTLDASTDFAAIYWVLLVVVGAFFILSLTVVVITEAFEANSDVAKEALREAMSVTGRTDERSWIVERAAIFWAGCCERYGKCAEAVGRTQPEQLRVWARNFCDNIYFQRFIIGAIMLNTLQMSVQHHQQPQWLTDMDDCNAFFWCSSNVFTIIFGVEVFLKIYGHGLGDFWVDGFNRFDFFVVITGVAEMIGDVLPISPSVLRTFRVLRILKLAQRFPELRKWTVIIITSMKEASVLTVLMFLVIFIAALLGMQFFGGNFCGLEEQQLGLSPGKHNKAHCDGLPRSNYDSLHLSLVTSFQIISGEDWNQVMYMAMRATGDWLCVYFVLYHTIGSYIILNLFIAVLLSNRNADKESGAEDLQGGVEAYTEGELMKWLPHSPRRTAATFDTARLGELLQLHGLPQRVVQMLAVAELDGRLFMRFDDTTLQRIGINESHWARRLAREREYFITDQKAWLEPEPPDPEAARLEAEVAGQLDELLVEYGNAAPGEGSDWVLAASDSAEERAALYDTLVKNWEWGCPEDTFAFLLKWVEAMPTEEAEAVVEKGDSELLWSWLPDVDICPCYPEPEHPCREWLLNLCEHPVLEGGVLFAICLSTVTLALENPLRPPDHEVAIFLAMCDLALTVVFWFEMLLKGAAYGFIGGPDTYLRRDGWNRLDCFIVLVSTSALLFPNLDQLSFVKVLRTLRPLRFIHRVQGMKTAVHGLLRSLPAMVNIVAISSLIMLIFGILGMQLFSGTMYRCSRDGYGDVNSEPEASNRTACVLAGLRWENYPSHFDNIGSAFLSLFEVCSLEGWVGLMNVAVDAKSYDEGPVREENPGLAYYFLFFIIIGSFFMVNLFIGVLIDAYTTEKESSGEGTVFLTTHQKEWIRAHKSLRAFMAPKGTPEPLKGAGWCRRKLHAFATHPHFDNFITLCIVANIFVMSMEHHGASEAFNLTLENMNLFFVVVFALEALVKIIALGRHGYFGNPWNRFDLLIVILSCAPLLIELGLYLNGNVSDRGQNNMASQFRMLRLSRLLRMVKQAAGVRSLLRTLFLSLPSFSNIAALILLIYFIFAVMGLNLFGKVRKFESPYANFTNVIYGFLLLFRVSTGEGWQEIMADFMAREPYCDPRLNGCISPWYPAIFFCIVVLLCMYIMLNLFVAVILDGSSEAALDFQPEDWDMKTVEELWDKMSDHNLKAIHESRLEDFLRGIGPPLGPPPQCTGRQYRRFIMPLELCSRGGYLLQRELFPKLFQAAFGAELPDEGRDLHAKLSNIIERDPVASPTWGRTANLGDPVPVNAVMEVVLVQAHIRGWLENHRRRKLREALRQFARPEPTPDALLCVRCPCPLARVPAEVAKKHPNAKLHCQLCGRHAPVCEDNWAYCPDCVQRDQMHEVCKTCCPENPEDLDDDDAPPLPLGERQPSLLSIRRGRRRARTVVVRKRGMPAIKPPRPLEMPESPSQSPRAGPGSTPGSPAGSAAASSPREGGRPAVNIYLGGKPLEARAGDPCRGLTSPYGSPRPMPKAPSISIGWPGSPLSMRAQQLPPHTPGFPQQSPRRNPFDDLPSPITTVSGSVGFSPRRRSVSMRSETGSCPGTPRGKGLDVAEILQYWSAGGGTAAIVAAAAQRPVYTGRPGAAGAGAPPGTPRARGAAGLAATVGGPRPEFRRPSASDPCDSGPRPVAPPAVAPLLLATPGSSSAQRAAGPRCGEEALSLARGALQQRPPPDAPVAWLPPRLAALLRLPQPAAAAAPAAPPPPAAAPPAEAPRGAPSPPPPAPAAVVPPRRHADPAAGNPLWPQPVADAGADGGDGAAPRRGRTRSGLPIARDLVPAVGDSPPRPAPLVPRVLLPRPGTAERLM
eukprot:TRINITY_DN6115_c1_g1_i1.p1 TRINITY_DN6115_c1_g1~~TRINITY_DN6115_c1_g1_i1.p1  ORF type:complete len:2160 (+),score=713.69 TRINITY_DN6115_c1_g1_i1:175-6654(+)